MDGTDGIFILRIDFITGDFKITVKQTLYKNQGLSIKRVSSINSHYLLIVAEREYTMTKAYKNDSESRRLYNMKKKFETVIIRHSSVPNSQPQDSTGNLNQIDLPLRVHQMVRPPFFHEVTAPYYILQIYNQIVAINIITMGMTSILKIPNFQKTFPRIDLQSIMFIPERPQMLVIHDDQILQFSFELK